MAMLPVVTADAPAARSPASADALDLKAGSLNEAEAKALCAHFGVPVTREAAASTPREAAEIAATFGGPVVVKILSNEILHKSELGGVAVGVAAEDVEACCVEMQRRVREAGNAKLDGFLVQELVRGGTEMILGYNRDPQLGSYLLLGAGGVTTELYEDVAIRLLPINHVQAREMIDSLRCAALLKGFRGRPVGDIEALTDAILAFGDMAMALEGRLEEAEINPVFVLPEGQGVRAGDGLVVLS
jgi:succinyl-CoA synthetase beta subunit